MASAKLNPESEIALGEERYVWRLQRRPQWSKDPADRHGMAIAVRHLEGKREAIIEFPPGDQPRFGAPKFKPTDVPTDLVKRAIASALAAGWEPHTRGKPVNIVVDATGA